MARGYKYKHYCGCGKGIRLKDGWKAGICSKCEIEKKSIDTKCVCGSTKRRSSDKCLKCQSSCDCGGRKSPKSQKCKACLLVRHRDCVICGSIFKVDIYANKRVTCSDDCKAIAIKRSAQRAAVLGSASNREAGKKRQKEKIDKLLQSKRADKGLCVCCLSVMELQNRSTCSNCTSFITKLIEKLQRNRKVKRCKVCDMEFTNEVSQSSSVCSRSCYRKTEKAVIAIDKCKIKRRKATAAIESIGRRSIFKRDNWTCQYCGQCVVQYKANGWLSGNEATLDHVIPLSHGGSHSVDNVVTACRDCNTQKGAKMFTDGL
jgi:5-methylcytosine-specific restriction endonuclease McrA